MIFKEALKCIVAAQVASDGGKRIEETEHILRYIWYDGYHAKDNAIKMAIKIINKTSAKNKINYFIDNGDIDGSVIIYFNIETPDGVKQISFHSFDYGIKKMIGSGQHCLWDQKSSRDAAIYLVDKYELFVENEKVPGIQTRREKISIRSRRKLH